MTPRPGQFYTRKDGGPLLVVMPIRWHKTIRFNVCSLEVDSRRRDMTLAELGAYLKANGYRPYKRRKP